MPIQKISIEQFLQLPAHTPIFDVRSPGEYMQAHINGAQSLPLFTDEERKVVGTAYKQQGKQKAIKLGLDFFGVKMKTMVEEVEKILGTTPSDDNKKEVVVHCWRGGMRSAGVAWLMDLFGYKVYTIVGGYKAYRNWVLQQFEKEADIRILGGYTGSGKTKLLHQLQKEGQYIIDLEGLAKHKGSAFGAYPKEPQPRQEMFENLLAQQLHNHSGKSIWIEDESQRIGVLNIPKPFWKTMRSKPIFFIDIPFEERLNNITQEYGSLSKELLVNAIIRIQKRLGPMESKTAIGFLLEDDYKACFSILLSYYDKTYTKSLQNRENTNELLNKIHSPVVDTTINTAKLLSCATQNI